MEDKYGLRRQRSSGVWRSLRDGDFEEEDVWSVFKDKGTSINIDHHRHQNHSPNDRSSRHAPPRAATSARATSAPVNVPGNNWSTSNINSKASYSSGNNSGTWHGHDDHDGEIDDDDDGFDDNDDDDYGFGDDDPKLPPHELIDRRLAKRQISSFSVFEGVGRTLKGRDLSKVRNAVLTKTGFLESF